MSKWSPEAVTDIVLKAIDKPGFAVVLLWRNDGGIHHEALGDMSVLAEALAKVQADAPREAR